MGLIIALLYLDPSTGSMAHQIVVGFILVATTFWRKPWRKLADALRREKPRTSRPGSTEVS